MEITLNGEKFYVEKDEYSYIGHHTYTNLKIINKLGEHERIISLLEQISKIYKTKPDLLYLNITHGGYIPIKCANNYSLIYVYTSDNNTIQNLYKNIENKNINTISVNTIRNSHPNYVMYLNCDYNNYLGVKEAIDKDNIFIISVNTITNIEYLQKYYKTRYQLENTNLSLWIPDKLYESFYDNFKYYLEENNCYYDNLIHYTMIVKNAGNEFEDVLTKNLPFIDRWTILDTGSTDNTIEIIKKVLVGKKPGNLYQEPFINFRDSRNRCLDLAGKHCKYNLMLDDTYVIQNDLRKVLNTIRGDQFATSYSLYVLSKDVEYVSNRITKSEIGLRYMYKLHEIITDKNNVNVCIPKKDVNIFDVQSSYMEERTNKRKEYDLKILFEMAEEEPENPRHLYYIAQTYNIMNNPEKAVEYFLKRTENPGGYIQEIVDSYFEAARIYNFKLNKPWNICEELYLKSSEFDPKRPDPYYFIGIHYKNENDLQKAYENFKKAFELGYPIDSQHSLKPTLCYYFLPLFLVELCFLFGDYKTGLEACKKFLEFTDKNDNNYEYIKTWRDLLNISSYVKPFNYNELVFKKKPNVVFIQDGGFKKWTGRDIEGNGMGGSETFTIEISRYLQRQSKYDVIVFCNCESEDVYEGVQYIPLNKIFDYFSKNIVNYCFVSRYSEYLPVAYKGQVDNIYLMLHDLRPTGVFIPLRPKLRNIICLSDWHVEYFVENYNDCKDISVSFGYGIDFSQFSNKPKIKNKFIYSSFANRGLVIVLKLWPEIKKIMPDATLDIYSDLENNWVNTHHGEQIKMIKQFLREYSNYNNSLDICNHGWVNKNELYESWSTADIWFYPCMFLETFCHTALEAAASKTLVITNGIGALKQTVGDRGIVIKTNNGDPTTDEWQTKAL